MEVPTVEQKEGKCSCLSFKQNQLALILAWQTLCFPSKANPSDCVDMDCDAKKKTMLRDLDGSFLGAVGTVIPQSEFEWGGDPRRGLGDYRLPSVMLTRPNGSRIPVEEIAPHKGSRQEDPGGGA